MQAFVPLERGIGVRGDAAPDAEDRRAIGGELHSADRHVQLTAGHW